MGLDPAGAPQEMTRRMPQGCPSKETNTQAPPNPRPGLLPGALTPPAKTGLVSTERTGGCRRVFIHRQTPTRAIQRRCTDTPLTSARRSVHLQTNVQMCTPVFIPGANFQGAG